MNFLRISVEVYISDIHQPSGHSHIFLICASYASQI
nr:MAG TPA: phospholipase C/S1-P1 nuclease [Caudoviricetes sp.]